MADRSRSLSKPHRFALVAAAEVIAAPSLARPVNADSKMLNWQERAWDFYDQVGEFRFGVSWTSNALSRVNLTAARPPANVGDEPTALSADDETLTPAERRALELVEMIAGGASGQGQLMNEFGEHLSVAGFGWMIAEPDLDDPDADAYETWAVYSQDAVRITKTATGTKIEIRRLGSGGADAWRQTHPNALVTKVWRKHPRRPWEPDAPVRGVLGVLEIIQLLTDHITATGRSRLAGAGILAIPSEAEFPPPPPPEGEEPDEATEQDKFDYFVEQLTVAMTTPIRDRDSAAAVVPLPLSIPGEWVDKLKHISFATPFDERVSELLQDAIKRLALGLDMPPEVLTGMAGVNHWTAWQVEETAITLHVEPNAEIICNALNTAWLAPALEAEGFDPAAAMVWYDTGDLTSPPDKSGNVIQAYDRREASGLALRRELGLGEADKPSNDEFRERLLLDVAKGAPAIAPMILAEAGYMSPAVADVAAEAESTEPGPDRATDVPATPETETDGPPPADDRPGADLAALMACDGIVDRAMEMAGKRLMSFVGKKSGGPQAVDNSVDARSMHVRYDPTTYADLDQLLAGAFDRVPFVAGRLDLDADALGLSLKAYCRGLLAAQHPHDLTRLAAAIGVEAG